MTDKRLFGVVKGHREHITDHTGRLYSDSEVADLLNTVHEENEQLKQEKQSWLKTAYRLDTIAHEDRDYAKRMHKENEELKEDIKNLKITINARETLIDVCEKKFKELGYIITVDDDGYVIE